MSFKDLITKLCLFIKRHIHQILRHRHECLLKDEDGTQYRFIKVKNGFVVILESTQQQVGFISIHQIVDLVDNENKELQKGAHL